MCVGNVDNDQSGAVKIVVGSYNGMLRVFQPRQKEYNVQDLLLEQSLGEPILQVAIGRFAPGGSADFALAVLLPRKLVVNAVVEANGATCLKQLYVHTFDRTAANLCYGPFGQHVGPGPRPPAMQDELCVQSMDGCLHFFKQEVHTMDRFLPNFLLPGPLIYVPVLQSYITANSQMKVCAYKHNALASSTAEKMSDLPANSQASDSAAGGKRVQAAWEGNVGEHVLDIKVGRWTNSLGPNQVDILVLGEHTLFCLTDTGEIRTQKRLEYNPQTLCPFPKGVDRDGLAVDSLLVASNSPNKVYVYSNEKLEWVAGLPSAPVSLGVCEFAGLKGLITSLDDSGTLSVSYLGTDPPASVVKTDDSKELNYEEMDEEHRALLGVIREATSDMKSEPTDRVLLRVEMPTRLDPPITTAADGEPIRAGSWESRAVTAKLIVSYTGSDTVENLQIEVAATDPVVVDQETITIDTLSGGRRTPLILPLRVHVKNDMLPAELVLPVVATYLTKDGKPRTARWDIQLPLCLVCSVVPPVKNAGCKITLETNQPPPQLSSIFEDVVAEGAEAAASGAANVLTFQYWNGMDVTVLVSKSSNRYRLQSNDFHCMWLILHTLTKRLIQYFQGARGPDGEPTADFAIELGQPLPLELYFSAIDNHLSMRHQVAQLRKMLEDRSHQFRSVQKRLLVKFKERNPAVRSQHQASHTY
jgi:Bardet-Biedl syndrome 9 protein